MTRIVRRTGSWRTMKKFSAYISVPTISCRPRSSIGMSMSEPDMSEIANSARCSRSAWVSRCIARFWRTFSRVLPT